MLLRKAEVSVFLIHGKLVKLLHDSVCSAFHVKLFHSFRPECEAQVKGYTGAIYKKFKTQNEANQFIAQKRTNATLSTVTTNTTASIVGLFLTKFCKIKKNDFLKLLLRTNNQEHSTSDQSVIMLPDPRNHPKNPKLMKTKPQATHQTSNKCKNMENIISLKMTKDMFMSIQTGPVRIMVVLMLLLDMVSISVKGMHCTYFWVFFFQVNILALFEIYWLPFDFTYLIGE